MSVKPTRSESVATFSVKAHRARERLLPLSHKVRDCCHCLRQGPQGQRLLSLSQSRPTRSETVATVSVKAHKVRDCCHCLRQGPQGQRLLPLSPSRPQGRRLLPLSPSRPTMSETVAAVSVKAHKVKDCCLCLRQGPQGQGLLSVSP